MQSWLTCTLGFIWQAVHKMDCVQFKTECKSGIFDSMLHSSAVKPSVMADCMCTTDIVPVFVCCRCGLITVVCIPSSIVVYATSHCPSQLLQRNLWWCKAFAHSNGSITSDSNAFFNSKEASLNTWHDKSMQAKLAHFFCSTSKTCETRVIDNVLQSIEKVEPTSA